MRLGKSIFRNRIAYYELDSGTEVLLMKIKCNGGDKKLSTLYQFLLNFFYMS